MFRSQAMSKVELIVPEHDVVAVTEALAALDVFHLVKPECIGAEDAVRQTSEWRERANTFTALEQRILIVMRALDVDEGTPPFDELHLIGPTVAQRDVEHLEQESLAPVQELEEAQHKLVQLQRYLGQLRPIADLDVDLEALRGMRYLFVSLGTIPVANMERLRSSLELVPFVLVTLQREEHLATVLLFGMQRDADILNRAARSAYLNPLTPPDRYPGTPADAIEALQASIARTHQQISASQTTIKRLHATRVKRLRHLLWRVRASRTLVETIAGYGRLHYTYLIAGWVPDCRIPALRSKIEQVADQVMIEVVTPRREDEEHIPVVLDNPYLFRPFEGLVTNYGYPRYGELDPTPVMALTFPLVFGLMFGDVGHGLLLTLLGLLVLSRKVRALRGLASMGGVVVACGLMAMVFGLLYGSIFGFETVLEPLWIRPLEEITDVLLVAVGVGVVVLSLGMVYNIINAALARHWGHLLFDHNGLAGLMFYWSLLGLGAVTLGISLPFSPALLSLLVLVSGLAVTFAELLEHLVERRRPLTQDGFGTYLMQAFFELFETVIGLLSNTLSYVRMGAFAVAHGAISMVVFILAEIVSPTQGLGYWMVVVLGNLFVMGFEGMIVGIQTLRLEYYELFSKFFSGGGERYRPLELIPKDKCE